MASPNIETDPLFTLLTDALRAGPGSPQWDEAITALRQQGLEATDEHRMLMDARENLEAGRDYRSVRAGTGFTRKVMEEIEKGGSGPKPGGIPTATIVAGICGLLILSVVGYFVWKMSTRQTSSDALIAELDAKSQGFIDLLSGAAFAGSIPDGWHAIGSLKMDLAGGLCPDASADSNNKNFGGGIAINTPLPAAKPFAVDVALLAPTPTDAVLLEVFVSTDGNFSADKGTSSRDLVWQLRGKDQQVLVNGSGMIGDAPPTYHPGDGVRLIVGPEVAIVEDVPSDGGKPRRIWAGQNQLGAGSRYVGVRFLQTGATGKPDLKVQQVKIITAPGT